MEQNKVLNIAKNTEDQIEKFSNIDAEVAIIGCILWDNRNYEKVSDFLDESHFVDQNHQIIFSAFYKTFTCIICICLICFMNYILTNTY